jgi:hypothetical protein
MWEKNVLKFDYPAATKDIDVLSSPVCSPDIDMHSLHCMSACSTPSFTLAKTRGKINVNFEIVYKREIRRDFTSGNKLSADKKCIVPLGIQKKIPHSKIQPSSPPILFFALKDGNPCHNALSLIDSCTLSTESPWHSGSVEDLCVRGLRFDSVSGQHQIFFNNANHT